MLDVAITASQLRARLRYQHALIAASVQPAFTMTKTAAFHAESSRFQETLADVLRALR